MTENAYAHTLDTDLVNQARNLIHGAEHICVYTGAGMSADSGVPTYRDNTTGLWERYSPERLATEEGLRDNPDLVWSWLRWQGRVMHTADPHEGHLALARMQRALRAMGRGFEVVTQNIDDMHERAGAEVLAHLHGNLHSFRCIDCGAGADYSYGKATPEEISADPGLADLILQAPPACGVCETGFLRPEVVFFGEMLPEEALWNAVQASETCDLAIVIGTSSIVQPAASLPLMAAEAGARIIEINPNDTPLTDQADVALVGTALQVLPLLETAP